MPSVLFPASTPPNCGEYPESRTCPAIVAGSGHGELSIGLDFRTSHTYYYSGSQINTQPQTEMSSESAERNPTEAPKPEVRYVLSGQPTGWAAMGKEVRDFDEEKVKNSKEDIDTLLVFVGLPHCIGTRFATDCSMCRPVCSLPSYPHSLSPHTLRFKLIAWIPSSILFK